MKHLGNILFLILCFALGVGLAKYVIPPIVSYFRGTTPTSSSSVVTGVGRLMPYRGIALDPLHSPTAPALQSLLDHHATVLPLHYPTSATPEAHLTNTVQLLRANPATRATPLMLLPPDPPASGLMNPYPKPLLEIAQQAQRLGFDFLVVSWLSAPPDSTYWQNQLTEVRQHFTGKTIVAGDYDSITRVNFWHLTDYIGTTGGFQLSSKADPSVHDLRVAWASHLDTLESIARSQGKNLFILSQPAPAANPALLLKNYEALLLETKGRLSTDGIFFRRWSFSPNPAADRLAANSRPEILTLFASIWKSESASPDSSTPSSTLNANPLFPTFEDENTTEDR